MAIQFERRTFDFEQFETRADANNIVELRGYASTFNEPYEMHDMFGPYTETVLPGAFSETLARGADVQLLVNHGVGGSIPLARTTNGSLTLSQDSHGLLSVARVDLRAAGAGDLVDAIKDGRIDQMSFGFRVFDGGDDWSPDYSQRYMLNLNLHRGDVSAVNYGANPRTEIEVVE
ncbi:HK97 family phage prohead protease [Rhodococcus qingshengii]|uniref:HK97 family phage prohead protease n=1 Tax=Rhodococcus qingshengii TaxID=334542 RepID=UPI000815F7D4|nr:HK97 family phage prohead protease [Rhodococcus qingshengii]SCC37547.1 hypothetical protein GA0061093_107160 [Rhodococcus qingshengii]